MIFLLDESGEIDIAVWLRGQGHDVKFVLRDYPAGLSDEQVLALAVAENRVLITKDRDFGALIFQHGHPHTGVIYLRQGTQSIPELLARLQYVLATHASDLHRYLVVTERQVRVR